MTHYLTTKLQETGSFGTLTVVVQLNLDYSKKLSLLLAVLLGLLLSFSHTTINDQTLNAQSIRSSIMDCTSLPIGFLNPYVTNVTVLSFTRCFFSFVSHQPHSTTGPNKSKRMHPFGTRTRTVASLLYCLYYAALLVHPTVAGVDVTGTGGEGAKEQEGLYTVVRYRSKSSFERETKFSNVCSCWRCRTKQM